ncbi:hypothetical protein ACO0LC_28390 [Undibacterium sp. JH2W]|uniref:hypothetical protein n=1 Tax=Undibacterium sp. JH2W TaxID=3413037 RepID=UPI003BF07D51
MIDNWQAAKLFKQDREWGLSCVRLRCANRTYAGWRYLRSEVKEPAYADRQTASAIDKYAWQLSSWLKTEASKNRKQRRSLKQLHLDLKALGFEGSYDRVVAFARKWKVDQTDRGNSASKRTQA